MHCPRLQLIFAHLLCWRTSSPTAIQQQLFTPASWQKHALMLVLLRSGLSANQPQFKLAQSHVIILTR